MDDDRTTRQGRYGYGGKAGKAAHTYDRDRAFLRDQAPGADQTTGQAGEELQLSDRRPPGKPANRQRQQLITGRRDQVVLQAAIAPHKDDIESRFVFFKRCGQGEAGIYVPGGSAAANQNRHSVRSSFLFFQIGRN